MSDKLYKFVNDEVTSKKPKVVEPYVECLLKSLGYNNIQTHNFMN
jgi:hypothetical protein